MGPRFGKIKAGTEENEKAPSDLKYRRTRSLRYRAASHGRRLRSALHAWRFRAQLRRPAPRISAAPARGREVLVLVFNGMWGQVPELDSIDLPPGSSITLDRRMYFAADAVVFHVPDLDLAVLDGLPRVPGQLWVAWYLESEVCHPRLRAARFRRRFDLEMSYRQNADVRTPYTAYFGPRVLEHLRIAPMPKTEDRLAVFVASNDRDYSGRTHYAYELMRHLPVHSYGRCLRNRPWPEDDGSRAAKHRLIARYRFTLAFENSVADDYVTEKFFDPLMVGSVPVYLGARNVADFAPGGDCYIDASDFAGPRDLAEYLRTLSRDESAYEEYLKWKDQPYRQSFLDLVEGTTEHPFARLARRLLELRTAAAGAANAP
jgi:hypothetical protein